MPNWAARSTKLTPSHDMDSSPIFHLSLCAGYGGLDLGLKRACPALRTIAYAEIEAFACECLLARMEAGQLDQAPIWPDLKSFPWGKLRDRVDILSGGYPCQPFSIAGKRLGREDPRHLWPYIADGISILRPRLCFFENVEGHINLGLREVIEHLGRLGYSATWGIFSATEVGAPHQRKRVFILAHRIGAGLEGYHDLLIGCDEPRRESSQPEGSVGGSDSSGTELAHTECYGSPEGRDVREGPDGAELVCESKTGGSWPSCPGQPQFGWEPPRVVGNSNGLNGSASPEGRKHDSQIGHASGRQVESALGGDPHGSSGGMDYAELCVSCDNRTDELRLLGNGVVPAVAERAFVTLLDELLADASGFFVKSDGR